MEQKAYISRHSTSDMAGEFAREVRAKLLVLTHFSPRYVGYVPEGEGDAEDADTSEVSRLLRQAREAFGNENIVAAHDYFTLRVPRREGAVH
jgi:ribonuclease Z